MVRGKEQDLLRFGRDPKSPVSGLLETYRELEQVGSLLLRMDSIYVVYDAKITMVTESYEEKIRQPNEHYVLCMYVHSRAEYEKEKHSVSASF